MTCWSDRCCQCVSLGMGPLARGWLVPLELDMGTSMTKDTCALAAWLGLEAGSSPGACRATCQACLF
jgi:hypothetical protein